MNYYQILDVKKDASQEEIKSAYKKLVKKYHPDVYAGDKTFAEEKTQKINEAYDVLSNPEKKQEYDRSLEYGSSANGQYGSNQANGQYTTYTYRDPFTGRTYTVNNQYAKNYQTNQTNQKYRTVYNYYRNTPGASTEEAQIRSNMIGNIVYGIVFMTFLGWFGVLIGAACFYSAYCDKKRLDQLRQKNNDDENNNDNNNF